MARWPFTRASERPAKAEQPATEVLTGSFAWPADPLFRPTVGVFVDGVPCAVVPTYRVRVAGADGHAADWRCAFTIDRALLPAGRRGLDLRCMETGARVGVEPAGANAGSTPLLGIDDLIALSEGRGTPLDATGFAAFLALPAAEQVSLVYHGILGRGPDPLGWERHCMALRQGTLTILGIRDDLLASAEFREKRMPLLSTPFGHWLVWAGLADVAGHLVTLPSPGGAPPSSDPAPGFARMALGEAADAAALTAWTRDNAAAIAAFGAHSRAPASPPSPSPRPMSLGHPMSGMRAGEAGHKDKARVTIQGRAGSVLFGPYGRLPSGRYRLRLDLDVAPVTGAEAGTLSVEVVHGDILFGLAALRVAAPGRESMTLDFTVPADAPALAGAKFEYRLATDGRVRGTVIDLTLRRLGRTGAEAASTPAVADWLPLMTVGSSAVRVDGKIEAPAAAAGHVYFGPHRALLPGAYLMTAHLVATTAGGGVTLDVVDAALRPLASRKTTLAKGPQSATLAFEVPAQHDAAAPPLPLEFRLYKPAGPALVVTGLAIERTGPAAS